MPDRPGPILVVAGAIASKHLRGGEAWVRLNWALGLRRLGFDVVLLEVLPRSADLGPVRYFQKVARGFGFADRAVLMDDHGHVVWGATQARMRRFAESALLLVNISGNLPSMSSLFPLFRRRAYVDVDPGYTQAWHRQGLLGDSLERHHSWHSVGMAIGQAGCTVPDDGISWRTVSPPVVLEEWPVAVSDSPRIRFTTIASWRGSYGALHDGGLQFGLKAHEWRKLMELPQDAGALFEVALDIDADADARDRERLLAHGWHLLDPTRTAGSPDAFRRFIRASGAEFSPAQGVYVTQATGWFSDRSACYLASGKPVLIQETGFSRWLPSGEGLVPFHDLASAVDGARRITAAYVSHARAAREVARAHFDSDLVLARFLDEAGVAT